MFYGRLQRVIRRLDERHNVNTIPGVVVSAVESRIGLVITA